MPLVEVNGGETTGPARLFDEFFGLGLLLALHEIDEPLDVVLETGGAARDGDPPHAADVFEQGEVSVTDPEVLSLVDVDGELVNVAEALRHALLFVGEVAVQTDVDVELAYPGEDAGLLDGFAPGAEAGEGGEHGGVGEEGV